jgi:hypothetical protein
MRLKTAKLAMKNSGDGSLMAHGMEGAQRNPACRIRRHPAGPGQLN